MTATNDVSISDFLGDDSQYDYIICGGGTAGLVVAARLSENEHITVGVIEAGKNRTGDPLVEIPGLTFALLGNKDYDWTMKTVPQPNAHDVEYHVPRGKMLGGSSGMNFMNYVRGSDKDYDDWAELVNDDSWSSKEMKKYMKKHQTLELPGEELGDKADYPFVITNHGTDGPIHTTFNTSRLPYEHDILEAARKAAKLEGPGLTDPWNGENAGFYSNQNTISRSGAGKGKRSYATSGYFEAVKHRPNLKVICESVVTKIHLEDKRATAVSFLHQGTLHTVSASKEIILAAGSIHTPQLLELSGIGNPEILKAAGIPCEVDLPAVGENLQDHICSAGTFELANGIPSGDIMHRPEVMGQAMKMFQEQQDGPLTNSAFFAGFLPYQNLATDEEFETVVREIRHAQSQLSPESLQYRQYDKIVANLENPNLGFLRIQLIPATMNTSKEALENNAILAPKPEDPNGPNGLTFAASLEYPVSRGYVHIKSANVDEQPEIDPNYFGNPVDLALLGIGFRFIDQWTKQLMIDGAEEQGKTGWLSKRIWPPPSADMSDLSTAKDYLSQWSCCQWHWISTCAMGTVVDSELKIIDGKVSGLRIVDASVFPSMISGNIVATVYAVAEKAAEMILSDWEA